jgi:hypothetical protein
MMSRLRPRSIYGELALLVCVLVLPLIVLTAYLLYAQAQRELHEAEAVVRRLADSHAARAARFVADTRAVLQAVAWRPLVRAMDPTRCDPGLRDLLDLYPKAANFLVVNREGRILCGAIPPPRGRVLRISDEAVLREVLSTGSFALSRPLVGRISGHWLIAAVQPVVGEDGAIAGTANMSDDLAAWNLLELESDVPEGTVVSLVSGSVVIARTRDAEKWIGRDVSGSEIMQHVNAGSSGVMRALGVNEIDRVWDDAAVSTPSSPKIHPTWRCSATPIAATASTATKAELPMIVIAIVCPPEPIPPEPIPPEPIPPEPIPRIVNRTTSLSASPKAAAAAAMSQPRAVLMLRMARGTFTLRAERTRAHRESPTVRAIAERAHHQAQPAKPDRREPDLRPRGRRPTLPPTSTNLSSS